MTPNNILNMAMLKELDFLAITDHNSAKQLHVVEEIEKAYDFIFIPGIEVTVKEGFDVLCYFKTYEDVRKLDKQIEPYLNGSWGPFSSDDQVITDIYDTEISTFKKPLLSPSIPFTALYDTVKELNGLVILAHIERSSKSALNSHSLSDLTFDGIEIQAYKKEEFLKANPSYKKHIILTSSDSHSLLTISERENYVDLPEKSIDAFFNYFEKRDQHE
jgi:PHP family Zn ribbon phosphoesterase